MLRLSRGFVVCFTLLMLLSGNCYSAQTVPSIPQPYDNLQGLTGVFVLVETIDGDAKRDGLTTEDVITWVELRLRALGIKVLTMAEYFSEPGNPCLYVNVHALKVNPCRSDMYVMSVSVDLQETMKQTRPPYKSVSSAKVWESGMVSLFSASLLTSATKENVLKHVDKFANDYLAANPKK